LLLISQVWSKQNLHPGMTDTARKDETYFTWILFLVSFPLRWATTATIDCWTGLISYDWLEWLFSRRLDIRVVHCTELRSSVSDTWTNDLSAISCLTHVDLSCRRYAGYMETIPLIEIIDQINPHCYRRNWKLVLFNRLCDRDEADLIRMYSLVVECSLYCFIFFKFNTFYSQLVEREVVPRCRHTSLRRLFHITVLVIGCMGSSPM